MKVLNFKVPKKWDGRGLLKEHFQPNPSEAQLLSDKARRLERDLDKAEHAVWVLKRDLKETKIKQYKAEDEA